MGLLNFGGLEFANVDADMVPLGHLERATGTPVYGLIGLNLLARLEFSIDFEGGFPEFRPVNRRGDLLMPITPDTADVVLVMTGNDWELFVDGSIAGKSHFFCLPGSIFINSSTMEFGPSIRATRFGKIMKWEPGILFCG